MHMLRITGAAAILGLQCAGASAAPFMAPDFSALRPHRAVYDLQLQEASERSGLEAMTGRIVYEMTGNQCEGVTVRYRFVTSITTADNAFQTDQQTSTFESPDGKEFTFVTKTFVDDRPESAVQGTAIRTGDSVKVSLEQPAPKELELRDANFISTHMVRLIDEARKGQNFIRRPIFDGSDGADEVVESSTVIGASKVYGDPLSGESQAAIAPVAGEEAWPVTISYFDKESGAQSETLPAYEASFLLYENGVSRKLVMRYPDYSLTGALTSLEMLKETPCEKQ